MLAEAARDQDFQAWAVSGRRWVRVQTIKGVPRSAAADLGRLADGPVRHNPGPDGPRAQTLHHVLVQDLAALRVADSVPAWRIVRNYDRPVTCVPQRDRAMAIDQALPHGRDSVQVSAECSDRLPDLRCPDKRASIDRDPASGQAPATLPASALGQVVRVAASDRDGPEKMAAEFDPVDPDKVVAAFDLDVLVKAVAEFGPTDRVAVRGLAKMVADSKSARTVPVDRIDPMDDPDVPIDLDVPVIVGPT